MEDLNNLFLGFLNVLQPGTLIFCFIGCLLGTLIGVLPGIGPVGTMSLLLAATYKMPPLSALVMLAGIYYGAQYGGSTTAILVNIPGEAASVVTCMDGHQMALQGRGGPALGIAALGSFIAGTLGVVGLMLLAPLLASAALQFGPPEYFSLMCLGLTLLTYLTSGSLIRAMMMAVLGIMIGCIGQDQETGIARFGFGVNELLDGVALAPFAMGLFGISEVLLNVEKGLGTETRTVLNAKITNLLPTRQDWADSIVPILRGSIIGFFLGILPGGGAVIASFASYAIEKKVSRHPEKFGYGAIEGVAAPEAANNSAAQGAFIPLLTLGIPSNVVMALMMGALMIHDITPGPLLIPEHPEVFWGIVASMYIGNIMLVLLNLPLIGIWVKVLQVPYKVLFPMIIIFCLIGAYSINNSTFDIGTMLLFGVLGYLMRKYKYEGSPMILAFVLGPMLENSLRQSLLLSDGSFTIFFTRPIAGTGMALTLIMVLSFIVPILWKKRTTILR